jgi:hypothetical protein
MQTRDFALVLIRLLGLYWVAAALLQVPAIIDFRKFAADAAQFPGGETVLTMAVAGALFTFLIGFGLIPSSRPLASALVTGATEVEGPPLTHFSIHALGFSLLGAWLTALALPNLAANAVLLVTLSRAGQRLQRQEYLASQWPELLQTALQVALGVALFFGARELAALWNRVRPIRSRPSDGEGPPSLP